MPSDFPAGSQRSDADSPSNVTGEPGAGADLEALKRLVSRRGAFQRYRLEGEIARGGMGAILRVWDEDLQRHLAMKVVLGQGDLQSTTPPVESSVLSRFLDEAQVTSQLDHPGIVPVHELGLDDRGRVYFTMKLVKGKTLTEVFDERASGQGTWTQARVLGLIQRVCEAMAYAHHKGVIHRDLKPSNVMVGRYGEVYVMDWGLARVLDGADAKDLRIRPVDATSDVRSERRQVATETPDSPLITMDGDVVGTPSFMSPEQAAGLIGRMGPTSDVYAVGAMLYQMLAGQMPYVPRGARLNNYAIWRSVQEGPPAPLSRLAPAAPSELVAICEKAMARAPEDRYRDMAELSSDLAASIEGRVVHAYESGSWAEVRKWIVRNRALACALAAGVVLLLGGTAGIAAVQAAGRRAADAQRVLAEESAVLASAERDRADAKTAEAEQRAREARWLLYLSCIREADAASRADEPARLRHALDSAPEELRGWEWRHLDDLADTSVRSFPVRSGLVGQCWFSSDGERLCFAYEDGTIDVLDSATGAPLARIDQEEDAAVVPLIDAGRILIVARSGKATLFDDATGVELGSVQRSSSGRILAAARDGRTLVGSTILDGTGEPGARLQVDGNGDWGGVSSASFSSDGRRIVTALGGLYTVVWESTSGHELCSQTTGSSSARLSPDGTRLATVERDGAAALWDVDACKLSAKFGGPDVSGVTFSPSGCYLAAPTDHGTVSIWNVASATLLTLLRGHCAKVTAMAFGSNESLALTASTDATARLWRLDRAPGAVRLAAGGVTDLAFSPDGTTLITAAIAGPVLVWDSHSGERLARIAAPAASAVDFHPDGTVIATGSSQGCCLWDAASGRQLSKREHSRPQEQGIVFKATGLDCVEFSPDGTRLLTLLDYQTVELRDVADLETTGRIEGFIFDSARFDALGDRIVTACMDDSARIWDARTGELESTLVGHRAAVGYAAFSHDGSKVVTASDDATAAIWNASSGALILRLEGHAAPVRHVAFAPDDTRVVTCSEDRTAGVWDVATGTLLLRLPHPAEVSRAVFSPDGTTLATASDGDAWLWTAGR